jgi:hypothetical protein
MHFTRTLQKHVTKTGAHYVLSIPREIAQDLDLKDGGLCGLEIRTTPKGKAEVVLTSYQDDPFYVHYFNIKSLDTYEEPLMMACPLKNPVTKGRSQPVTKQQFKLFIASSNLALKYFKARLDKIRSTRSSRAALAIALRKRGFR